MCRDCNVRHRPPRKRTGVRPPYIEPAFAQNIVPGVAVVKRYRTRRDSVARRPTVRVDDSGQLAGYQIEHRACTGRRSQWWVLLGWKHRIAIPVRNGSLYEEPW